MNLKKESESRSHAKNELKGKTLVGKTIFTFLIVIILFIESIIVLISVFKRGIWKREVLTKKSNIGFDIDIILRE